jgi:branched-chain amino acid aminotransferase
MPIASTPKVWMNGELVDWERAQVHVLTHTLHYGTGVFEGMRAYPTPNGPAIFRLTEHIERLHRSAHILMMPLEWSVADLVQASKDTVNSTGLDACYVRPLVYYGYGEMGLNTLPCTVDVAIACWPWAALHGMEVLQRGVRLKVSSWRRHDHNTMPPAAKTVGNYVNSSLAQTEAIRAGYDGTIILNPQGLVSECAGENVFVVRNGTVYTPPLSAGALEGLTQASVRTILADLGIPLVVSDLARTDLYIADEMFTCGTAAEVGSVRSVDDRDIACPGPVTTAVAEAYSRATRGEDPRYLHWVETCR